MSSRNYTREDFLKNITLGTLAAFSTVPVLSKDNPFTSGSGPYNNSDIPDNATILFQGDSITDAGRNRSENKPNSAAALGRGYAFLASSTLLHHRPEKKIRCFNRGISGNKVFQLAERWQPDCLQLEPDILSILVGVNDFWHTLDFGYEGTASIYESDYKKLLNLTFEELPDVQLIIGEPFALQAGSAVNDAWFPEFFEYRAAAKRIAKEFNAAFIPFQSIFDEATDIAPSAYWSTDGVHPTLAGSHLMATAWLEMFKRL